MGNVNFEKFQVGQEFLIYQLIKKVYDEFVSKDCTVEGNRFFYDWIEPYKIIKRLQNKGSLFVAMDESEIVGMIEIRDNNRISLLFIDKAYHRQGIARKLFQKSLKNCLKKDPSLEKFYVHASPYSIPVYKKLGFSETDKMQETLGIKYLPMEMSIKK